MIFLEKKDLYAHPDFHWIIFQDENGESVLAKCKTLKEARARMKHHKAWLKAGKLLRPDASANL